MDKKKPKSRRKTTRLGSDSPLYRAKNNKNYLGRLNIYLARELLGKRKKVTVNGAGISLENIGDGTIVVKAADESILMCFKSYEQVHLYRKVLNKEYRAYIPMSCCHCKAPTIRELKNGGASVTFYTRLDKCRVGISEIGYVTLRSDGTVSAYW